MATVTVEEHPLWRLVSLHRAPNRAGLPTGPRPAQGEPAPRLQQALTVEEAHVHPETLPGRGLLVEQVRISNYQISRADLQGTIGR
jgi:hypothetical protein